MKFSSQFAVFVAGGLLCALIDIGLMQLLLRANVSLVAATSAGFLAGLLVNYVYHARVTFNNMPSAGTLARFMCVVLVNYLITVGLVAAAVWLFDLPLLGKLVSLPVVAVNGFFLSKHWIFK